MKFRGKSVSPVQTGETAEEELFFLAGGLLAGDDRFFLGGGAAGFGLFLTGLLAVSFRGFVSHDFNFLFTAVNLPAE
jgi:hypothetical protein